MVSIMVLVLITSLSDQASVKMWVETTQEDFRDGYYEGNIYASQRDGGMIEFTTKWDLNCDGYLDIVVSNERANSSYIYWGSANGYSSSNLTVYNVVNGGNCETQDVDNDGYCELIFSSCTGNCIRIFKGTPDGPDPCTYTNLPLNQWNESCLVADLNKDGYLDIVAGQYSGTCGAIFWGSQDGFSVSNITELPAHGYHNFEVADFDKNGWLDILFVQQSSNISVIFLGDSSGFHPTNKIELNNPGPLAHGSSVADLNNDSYLDVVLTCFGGSNMYIYKNSPTGFTLWQVLSPGYCYGGSSIADFNNDGYLDILCTRGYGVQEKPLIYWGGKEGFSESNKSEIGVAADVSGLLVADFNYDGILDVLIHNYAYPPQPSYILAGPDYTPVYQLPSLRDHHSRFREVGNIYNRKYYEEYTSSVYDAQEVADWKLIEWQAVEPPGASVELWVRSGDTPQPDNSWSTWVQVTNGGSIPGSLNARYLQYRAKLAYTNPARLPCLNEVRVYYTTIGYLSASVRIEPEVINLKSHGTFTAFITLPPGYDPEEINYTTVFCEGAQAISGYATPFLFVAKFNIQDLCGVVPGPNIEFMLQGELIDGTQFIGYDTVCVINTDLQINCSPSIIGNSTLFSFVAGEKINVEINIYDISGSLIRSFNKVLHPAGVNQIMWDRTDEYGHRVPAGVYFYQIKTSVGSYSGKIVVLK